MSQSLPPGLDERGRALLDFEREWPLADGSASKEERIRAVLGISKQRYHELLVRLVDSPAAYAYDPMTVLRLRRRRARLDRRRTAEALGERQQ